MRPVIKNMPARFTASTNGFSGTMTPGSKMKTRVEKDCQELTTLAANAGTTEEEVAVSVLSTERDKLERYIQSKGEVPVSTMNGVIVQAALLRMEDICVIARSSNMSEDDALAHIMEAESEAISLNTAAKNAILPPSTQACLTLIYKNITDKVNVGTNSAGICSALDYIRKNSATPLNHDTPIMSDNFNYGGTVRMNNFDLGGVFSNDTGAVDPSVINSGVYSEDTSGEGTTNNPSDNSSSVFTLINNIAKSATTVGGSITSTAAGLSNTLNTLGGGIGASAISQYLSQNWWKILGFIVLVVLIIIVMIHAAKNK